MKPILSLVTLLIDDYDTAIAHYTGALGFELLEDTDLSIADIAQRIGYDEAKYFIHVFKQQTGFLPDVYTMAERVTTQADTLVRLALPKSKCAATQSTHFASCWLDARPC